MKTIPILYPFQSYEGFKKKKKIQLNLHLALNIKAIKKISLTPIILKRLLAALS